MKGVAVTIAAALLFPLSAKASQDDVRALAERVAKAYAIGDAASLGPVWSAQSAPAARRVRIELEQASRIECHELQGVAIDSADANDAEATVRATLVRSESSRVESKHLLLNLRREDGAWRLAGCGIAERAIAKELVADPARWDRLARDEPEMLTRDLALALSDLASLGRVQARPAEAKAAAAALGNLAAFLGDASTRSLAATAEATLAEGPGDLAGAKAHAAEAVTLARQSNDAEVLMRAFVIQSRAFERGVNGYAPALEVMEEALRLADRVDNRLLVAYVIGNIGNLNMKQGKYAEALTYFQRAAAISREIDDTAGVMKTESSEGLLLQIEGNNELAVLHILRAIQLGANDPANDAWRGQDYISLAQSYTALGRDRESNEALHKAEELGRRSKAPIVIGETHRLLGSSYRRAHDYAAATRELEQALATFEAAKRIHFIPAAMSELALTRLEAGDARDAVARADRCAAYSRNMNEELPYIECRTFAGEAHRALGENDAALAAFRDAIDSSEERRRMLIGDARQRTHFLEKVISPYLAAADLLAERGDVAAAFEMTEQAKSRELLDILAGDVTHAQSVLTPKEEQRNGELVSRIAALNRRLRDVKGEASKDALSSEIAAARAEFESYQLILDAAHPRRLARAGSVSIVTAADAAPLISESTAIIEYVVSADHARAFVVTADRGKAHVVSIRLPAGGGEIDRLVRRFTEALAQSDLSYRKDARSLYSLLLHPLERALHGRKALCIVPDGSLWRLPFEALIDGQGRFVIESHACFYAPSVSVLAQVTRGGKRPPATKMLLAVGNPAMGGDAAAHLRGLLRDAQLAPIKESEEEVRALRALYGAPRSRVYVGREATKEHVTNDMESSRVLHFATHAIFDEDNPMYSEVVLAESRDATDDGLLAAWEIMRLNLRADIVVLSACETARGEVAQGEGIIGFTWALFVAGCPSSVVSQWKVDSASTKRLMVAFHRALLGAHGAELAKAEALRAAKLALLRDPRWRHPFYWSAFVLVGSARSAR